MISIESHIPAVQMLNAKVLAAVLSIRSGEAASLSVALWSVVLFLRLLTFFLFFFSFSLYRVMF